MMGRALIAMVVTLAPATAFAAGEAKAEAREHFDKGVTAYNERRFVEAADEFEAAYRLSPAFVVLYNIGQVNVMLGRSVEAVSAFNRYLQDGGAAIPAERRLEVQRQIVRQEARVGTIFVRAPSPGAAVRLDGRLVGRTPLPQPLRVVAGRHTVEVVPPGGSPEVREVDVVGQGALIVELAPPAVEGPPAPRPEPPAGPPAAVRPASGAAPPVVDQRPVTAVSWQRVCGYSLALAGLATGTVGALMIAKGARDANEAAPGLAIPEGPTRQMRKMVYDDGKALNERGWAVAAAGAATLAGGLVLVVTAPEPAAGGLGLAPWVTPRSGGLAMAGRW